MLDSGKGETLRRVPDGGLMPARSYCETPTPPSGDKVSGKHERTNERRTEARLKPCLHHLDAARSALRVHHEQLPKLSPSPRECCDSPHECSLSFRAPVSGVGVSLPPPYALRFDRTRVPTTPVSCDTQVSRAKNKTENKKQKKRKARRGVGRKATRNQLHVQIERPAPPHRIPI